MLDKMDETMDTPREGIKEHGPAYSKLTYSRKFSQGAKFHGFHG